jgi:shikimate dehydrogenase
VRPPLATTRVAAVIGDPVQHSLSPVLHNAAFQAMGLDWVYVAFPVPAGSGVAAVAAMRTFGIGGLSVTMPHKADVAGAVDRLTPVAGRLGVVNTVILTGSGLLGDSTDGPGLIDALREDEGWHADGRRCVVLGTGGAARAVCLALAGAGAAAVVVVGRRPEAAAACATLAGSVGSVGTIAQVDSADLVVNATSVGMGAARVSPPGGAAPLLRLVDPGPDVFSDRDFRSDADDGRGGHDSRWGARPSLGTAEGESGVGDLPFDLDPGRFGAGQLVVDLIYAPPLTPLLRAARARGAGTANGIGMLVHQAGRQIQAWTGAAPPLDAMSAALLGAGPFDPLTDDGSRPRS